MADPQDRMVDPTIFAALQTRIDEDVGVREQLRNILNELEKRGTNGTTDRRLRSLTQHRARLTVDSSTRAFNAQWQKSVCIFLPRNRAS